MTARRWAPVLGWAILILLSSSIPGPSLPQGPGGADKVVHFILYGVLGVLTLRAALTNGAPRARAMLLTLAAIGAFAAFDEWRQGLVPARSPDPADWVADMAGATAGIASVAFFTLRRSARS